MKNNLVSVKNDIINILSEENIYECLTKGKNYLSCINDLDILTSDICYELVYFSEDLFYKCFELESGEEQDRFYYQNIFAEKSVIFCNEYIKRNGVGVFDDEFKVKFLIEVADFYELANKYDEKFSLLESIVNDSNIKHLKVKAIDQILAIGGLNKTIFDRYTSLKEKYLADL